jgi:aryl-alcohol dehydrogenase-like predicted oxidoreductase
MRYMFSGHATPAATADYAMRQHPVEKPGFYRQARSLTVSSLGIGTYLGRRDDASDASYTDAVRAAVQGGINFIDTSLNYRHQHSERNIGAALEQLFATGEARREEVVLCTKAGYLIPGAVPELDAQVIVENMHCMAPAFLRDQLARSLRNLGVGTVDIFYLHNPETQLSSVPPDEFYRRTAAAFDALEELVREGQIRYYGAATWDGLRKPGALSLTRMASLAERSGGSDHHFRFVQLPVNLAMPEAYTVRREALDGEMVNVLTAAERLGITVVGSASILQSRLASVPVGARRAIQFARSMPGITVSLVGMGRRQHVDENLAIAGMPPLAPEEYEAMLRT